MRQAARPLRAFTRFSYWLCLALLGAAACSGIKTYPDTYEKNAVLRLKTDSGSFFSRTRADLDLYAVDTACKAEYLGSLKLEGDSIELGLPVGGKVLLVYLFSRSALVGRDSATSLETMITPRKGYRYEFEVSYQNSMFGATGWELAPGRRPREIERALLRDCVKVPR